MDIAIMKDLNNIFAYMPISEAKKESSVKTSEKKKDFITEIKEMTDIILKSADYIESNWDKLSSVQKENLKSFSYSYIGEVKMQKTAGNNIFTVTKAVYSFFKSLNSGRLSMSDIGDFFVALDRLNNVVLSMIKRDNPAYTESAVKGEGIECLRFKDATSEWNSFSLSSAMQGMENESSLYSLKDITESFT